MKNRTGELQLLYVLLAIILLYGFYVLLLAPRIQKNKELNEQISAEEMTVRGMYGVVANYETNRDSLLESRRKIRRKAEQFYSETAVQEQYLDLLDGLLNDCKLSLVSIQSLENETDYATGKNFTGAYPYRVYLEGGEAMSPEELEKQFGSRDVLEGQKLPKLERMVVTMECTGSYQGVLLLKEKLEENEQIILCSEFSVERVRQEEEEDDDAPEVRCILTMDFPRLSELSALDPDAEIPDGTFECVMPQELATGSYRKLYSPASWKAALDKLLHR